MSRSSSSSFSPSSSFFDYYYWCILLLLLLSVSNNNNNNNFYCYGLFVHPPSTKELYPQLKLSIADSLGVKYKGVAYNAGKAASYPGFALSLNAEFVDEPIDQITFDKLLKAYCGWSETKSQIKYEPTLKYTLLDFLPPLLQATSGLHFRSSKTKQKGLPYIVDNDDKKKSRRKYNKEQQEQEVLLTSNCWGFAWEVLFQADNADITQITISTADPTSAWEAFAKSPNFDLIQSSRTQPELLKDATLRNKKIKGGDVLLIWHQNPTTVSGKDLYLDHVATVIDNDVYYEKSGSGDKVPFRLSTWDMITSNFPPNIFFWEWRRLVRNNPLSPNVYGNVPRLQSASELFGVDSQIENDQVLPPSSSPSSTVVPSTSTTSSTRTTTTTGSLSLDRRSVFNKILNRGDVASKISLQTDIGDGGNIQSQLYTGILVLEDLVFDFKTGRATLPKSAFLPEWYRMVQDMNFN